MRLMDHELGLKRNIVRRFVHEMQGRHVGRVFSAWARWTQVESSARKGTNRRIQERFNLWKQRSDQHKSARRIAGHLERLWLGRRAREDYQIMR